MAATTTDPPLVPAAPGEPRIGFGGISRLAWLRVWFYVGTPLVLGFLLGWWRVGRSAEWPLTVAIAYWVGTALISTALQGVSTQLLSPLLRRLRSPLWLTLFLGQLAAGALLVMPALNAWRAVLRAAMFPDLYLEPQWVGFADFLQRMPTNSLLWVGLNLLFFYGLRMPRFGYEPKVPQPEGSGVGAMAPQRAEPAPNTERTIEPEGARERPQTAPPDDGAPARDRSPPAFMTRVRPDRRGGLLALEADGHYLHVHTSAGKDIILYRLSDALMELPVDAGARVHRSWWVARDALSEERHRDSLRLVNGLEIPVSRSYRLAARARGWIA